MIMNIGRYRVNKPYLETLLINFKFADIQRTVTECAVVTNVPLVALYSYAIEICGPTDELVKARDSIVKFYGYKSVEE